VRELGAAKAAELRHIVAPFLLRREKKEVLGGGSSSSSREAAAAAAAATSVAAEGATGIPAAQDSTSGSSVEQQIVLHTAAGSSARTGADGSSSSSSSAATRPAPMGAKHDLVVWLQLQPLQRHIYEAFLHSDAVKAALNSSRSPLAALTVLKKVCDHPALLSERATHLVVTGQSEGLAATRTQGFRGWG
jgi:hypothetical protein